MNCPAAAAFNFCQNAQKKKRYACAFSVLDFENDVSMSPTMFFTKNRKQKSINKMKSQQNDAYK